MKEQSMPAKPAPQSAPRLVPMSQTGQKSAAEIQVKYSGSQPQKKFK